MTKLQEAISILETLREDAKLALSRDWDRTDNGFKEQILLIDYFLSGVKRKKKSKFVQLKIWSEEELKIQL